MFDPLVCLDIVEITILFTKNRLVIHYILWTYDLEAAAPILEAPLSSEGVGWLLICSFYGKFLNVKKCGCVPVDSRKWSVIWGWPAFEAPL